jgi:hypothetical protein
MGLVRQARLSVRHLIHSLDNVRAIINPENHFQNMVSFAEKLLADAKAFEYLDSSALNTVGLAQSQRTVTVFQHLAANTTSGKPGCR